METNLNGLPVLENAVCRRIGLDIKRIPVYRGGQQVAWQEVDALSPSYEIREPVPAAKVAPPAKADYISLLKIHDWEYQHSDDGRAYRRGHAERLAIEALQPKFDSDFMLWNQLCHHMHRRVPAKAAS